MDKNEYKKCIKTEVLKGNAGLFNYIKVLREIRSNPSRLAVYLIRKMQYHAGQNGRWHQYRVGCLHMKLVKFFGMCVSPNVIIGEGLHLPHPTGIVLGDATIIGKNCSIYQNVTVGGARIGDVKKKNQPVIGDNVTLFAGSMVLGAINVGNECVVAANSVLLSDAEPGSVYAGSPARKVSKNDIQQ